MISETLILIYFATVVVFLFILLHHIFSINNRRKLAEELVAEVRSKVEEELRYSYSNLEQWMIAARELQEELETLKEKLEAQKPNRDRLGRFAKKGQK